MARVRVGVIYGGRSGEHEVSVVSAASVFAHLDRARYHPVPIRIGKDGRWTLEARPPTATNAGQAEVASSAGEPIEPTRAVAPDLVDVVFPVLHGPYGEDGTVQGLLELQGVPYVGAGVLGSALAMDKAVAKTLFAAHELPIVPHVTVREDEWRREPGQIAARVERDLGYPVFVKPANLGSSVGISKVGCEAALAPAVTAALDFDSKVVVEAAVVGAREIECGVLGNDDPVASVPGEIVVTHPDGFYSYDAKYIDAEGSEPRIPADLPPGTIEQVQRLSVRAFEALELAGLARVDFFLDPQGRLALNEVNTMPGFTSISMYPKMWAASGLAYPKLLDRLLSLARERHQQRRRLRTSRI